MSNWLLPSVGALLAWGLWAFIPKIASEYLDPRNILACELLGALVIGFLGLWIMDIRLQFHPRGSMLAVLAGAVGTLGTLLYLVAATRGRISVIVTLTALYPLVTILLSHFLLREPITLKQAIGMSLAIIAILFMAA